MVSAKLFFGSILAASLALASASPDRTTASGGSGKLTIVDCVYSKRALKFIPYHSFETHFIYESGGQEYKHQGENSHLFFIINRQREKSLKGLKVNLESDKTVKLSKDEKSFRTGKPNIVINDLQTLQKLCRDNTLSNDAGDLVPGFSNRYYGRVDSKAQVYIDLPNFF